MNGNLPASPRGESARPRPRRMNARGALLATAVLAFAASASTAAASRPTEKACIVYAETDAAAVAAYDEAWAAEKEAFTAYYAAMKEARPACDEARVALSTAKAARIAAYFSVYTKDGGMQNDVGSIMIKLINNHRETCRTLYGI